MPATSQITTQRHITDHKCPTDSLALSSCRSYNLNEPISFHLCVAQWLVYLICHFPLLPLLCLAHDSSDSTLFSPSIHSMLKILPRYRPIIFLIILGDFHFKVYSRIIPYNDINTIEDTFLSGWSVMCFITVNLLWTNDFFSLLVSCIVTRKNFKLL